MNTTALLYQHEDGRHAVAASAELATFAAGDPKWHRVGPADVSAMTAAQGTAVPAAEVIADGNGLRLLRRLPAGTRLYTHATPQASSKSGEAVADRDALIELIEEHLYGVYHCGRVWEAWQVGTMAEGDFTEARGSDLAPDLADAIVAATPAPSPLAETEEALQARIRQESSQHDRWQKIAVELQAKLELVLTEQFEKQGDRDPKVSACNEIVQVINAAEAAWRRLTAGQPARMCECGVLPHAASCSWAYPAVPSRTAMAKPHGYWETPEGRAEQLAARASRLLRLVQANAPAALIESARALLLESAACFPGTPVDTSEADAR